MTAAEALVRAQVRRELAARAKADDRTVKRVLQGLGKQNSAWERITEAMAALGVERPAPARLASVPPAKEGAL